MNRITFFVLPALLFFQITTSSFAQLTYTLHGGISKDMRSQTENLWKTGLHIGIQTFKHGSSPLSLGGRVAFHSRKADGQGWLKEWLTDRDYTLEKISGSQTVIEIMPAIRYRLTQPESKTGFALQGGAGILLVSASKVTVGGSYSDFSGSGYSESTIASESLTGYGIQVGAGITFVRSLELLPLYTVYLANGDAYHHYTLNIGFSFKM